MITTKKFYVYKSWDREMGRVFEVKRVGKTAVNPFGYITLNERCVYARDSWFLEVNFRVTETDTADITHWCDTLEEAVFLLDVLL